MKGSSFHLQLSATEVTLLVQMVACNLVPQAGNATNAVSCITAYRVLVYSKMCSSPLAGKVCQRHSPLVRLRFVATDFASCDTRQGSSCVLCAPLTSSHSGQRTLKRLQK